AFDYARDNERYKRSDWETAKYGIMLMALRAKFGHNPRLRKLLLDTGDAELIEDAGPKDACWGNGPNRRVGIGPADGRNYLGRMLMHVRDEIRTGQRKPFTVDHPCPAFDPRKTPRGPIIIP
ncbi:MAG TPA: NADAR family protein, partial [Candidatus Limnocylindria bacterium]|nr:NADAR family protein [Candidatus Limnocylindria bacterium]